MINKDNLKDLLKALNFEESNNIFSKFFKDTEAYLKVDFNEKRLIYPTDKSFIVNGDFTCNFSSLENFVVFECVHRLFEKGYRPEHIELEPKWKVGHGASGGRADILVKDNSNKSLLIIECKTEGLEFKKEWNNTLQRGGQLFSYAKQAGTTQYVCLYASDFSDNKIIPFYYIISLKDNEKLLEELKDKKPLSFADAKALEVEDIYRAWKETYNLDYSTKGVFEDDILPYQIGKTKYATTDLLAVGSKDIQSKYHEFATIMRQHNVSGRENAFDKLVNLFLCKIVDENKNPKDLKFNWKGIAYDSYFDLQDRLQLLYQAGMKEFLGEDVTYIDNTAIDKAFRFFKKDPDATKETIKKYFRQLKFFTNNDFAFIDVHNEKLFYQNSEILLKIVQMLQDIKLQDDNQEHQFLGDMFEGFLDNGVKQSEGQFFTPMPIVKFILNSLPLENIIQESELPPKAIDYACGAGHFLNELALQIKPFVEKHKKTEIKEYYKEIVGIEKEYRLSKVAKVSAFMYGQDDIRITYADALGKNAKLQENDFSILVANPPYAVKGFLQTLSETERKAYTLLNSLDEKSLATNNSIETFFIERAKQLLKPDAVAGIILPSSILSNAATIYTNAREILLKYFQIVAIAEFGSQTFGKTGTNTITLFLKRKAENPAPADHWKYRVDAWFTHSEADIVYDDSKYINKYCQHIEIDETQYKTLLKGNPSDELLATEIFTEYKTAFDKLTEIKNLIKQKAFKDKPRIDKELELRKRFVEFTQSIEKDKLYFYVLATENKQRVLVVKGSAESKEQKYFLGYEWSSAKGNEGIQYINQTNISNDIEDTETKEMVQKLSGLHNINTPLYNPNNRNDSNKINHYIQENFLGREPEIPEDLKSYITFYNLTDMLDFSRVNFNKQITLFSKKIFSEFSSKFECVKIENVLLKVVGNTTKIPNDEIHETGNLPVITQEQNKLVSGYTNNKNAITDLPLIVFGDHSCTFKYVDFSFVRGADGTKLMKVNPTLFRPKFFYYLMSLVGVENKDKYERHFKYLLNIKIPKLPMLLQNSIVKECQAIDDEVEKAVALIEKSKNELKNIINNHLFVGEPKKLIDLVDINKFTHDPTKEPDKEFIYVDIESIEKGTGVISYEQKIMGSNAPDRAKRKAPSGSILVSTVRPYLKGFAYVEQENEAAVYSTGFAILQSKNEDEILNKIIYYFIQYSDNLMEQIKAAMPRGSYPSINKTDIENFKILVPPIKDQVRAINHIEKLEQIIIVEQAKIDASIDKKKEIIKKYL
ncbi:MAG: N-6 DNA methylase [Treponemataceae bacterium]